MWSVASALVTLAAVGLVVGVGGGHVLHALAGLGPSTVLAAVGLGLVTTAAGALRWWVIARRLGLALTPRAALARCYEAQFLNLALPGGVLGDARRAVGHGREHAGGAGTARAVGAVVLERSVGQVVLVTTALVATVVGAGRPAWIPVAGGMVGVGAVGVAVGVGVGLVLVALAGLVVAGVARRGTPRLAGPRRVAAAALRAVLDPRVGPVALACSLVVVAGLVGEFVLAARSAGVVAGPGVLVGQALLALLAMAVPLGIAGWGPREAATAAGFALAGLDAGTGVATAAAYGVLALVAALPGGVLVLVGRVRRVRQDAAGTAAGRGPGRDVADVTDVTVAVAVEGSEEDRPWPAGPTPIPTSGRVGAPPPAVTIPAPRTASPTTASRWPTSARSSPG